MTQKERVRRAVQRRVKAGRTYDAGQLAKSLRLNQGAVRRILGELGFAKKKPTRGTALPEPSLEVQTTDEVKERIAEYLAETAAAEAISLEQLRDDMLEHMTRGPHEARDVAIVLTDLHGRPTPTDWFRPFDLARTLNAKPSTVRSALVELRREGRAAHDEGRAVSQGRWRMINRPKGYRAEDLAGLVPEDRDEQERLGIRKYKDEGGRWWLVAFDPGKHYPGPAGKKSHHRKVAKVGEGGRYLAASMEGGREIAVLATPLSELCVVDLDGHAVRPSEMGEMVLGVQPTRGGYHVYFADLGSVHQDARYLRASEDRGYWHERLFNDDGSPVQAPMPAAPYWHWDGRMERHAEAFLEAQRTAILEGLA